MSLVDEPTVAPEPTTRRGSAGRQTVIGLGAIVVVLAVIVAIALVGGSSRQLRADVLSGRATEPGAELDVTISIRDTAGRLQRVEVDFDDGNSVVAVDNPPESSCAEEPFTQNVDLRHTYLDPGIYTVRAVVVSGGCGARVERAEAVRTIKVKALRR
ncbi:MAG: hypothetical protein ACR2H3_06555 [Acidimicrobiales bacterium]